MTQRSFNRLPQTPPPPGPVRRGWDAFVFLLRVLWVCRVSAFSAIAGLLLFWFVTQAQNLLTDTSWNASVFDVLRFWAGMLLALFFLWAFPVHFAARRALDADDWLIRRDLRILLTPQQQASWAGRLREQHEGLLEWTPRVLGLLPFVAIFVGLVEARDTIARAQPLDEAQRASWQILVLAIAVGVDMVLFAWFIIRRKAMVDFFERRIGERSRGRVRGQDVTRWLVVASLLGTATIFVVAYLRPALVSQWAPRAALIPLLFGSPVLALGYLGRLSHRWAAPVIATLLIGAAIVTALNVGFNDVRTLPVRSADAPAHRQQDLDAAIARWRAANACAGASCPSPLIVAIDGGASRAAFMSATAVGDLLDRLARDAPASKQPGRQIFAISGVSGGALGAIAIRTALADAGDNGALPCRRAPRAWFRTEAPNSPFAPDRAANFTSWRDCLQALVSGDYLSPAFVGIGYRDNFAPPLQFISESLRIEDRAALLTDAWERHWDYVTCGGGDCARRESILLYGRSCAEAKAETGFCNRFGYRDGLSGAGWSPVLALNGTSVQTGRRIVSSDLVSTYANPKGDGRIALYPEAYDLFEMMSRPCKDLDPKTCAAEVASGATDLPARRDADDVRLSTAALNSARFPFISPAGSLHARGDMKRGDEVVDGGYFENSGLSTAMDIAAALRARGLQPIVLTISNEPEVASDDPLPPRAAATPGLGGAPDFMRRLLGIVRAPVDTLYNTRQGHGAEARQRAVSTLADPYRCLDTPPNNFFQIRVFARSPAMPDPKDRARCISPGDHALEMTTVSMSWWLSGTVQADLDAQLCHPGNQSSMNDLVARLRLSLPDKACPTVGEPPVGAPRD